MFIKLITVRTSRNMKAIPNFQLTSSVSSIFLFSKIKHKYTQIGRKHYLECEALLKRRNLKLADSRLQIFSLW